MERRSGEVNWFCPEKRCVTWPQGDALQAIDRYLQPRLTATWRLTATVPYMLWRRWTTGGLLTSDEQANKPNVGFYLAYWITYTKKYLLLAWNIDTTEASPYVELFTVAGENQDTLS